MDFTKIHYYSFIIHSHSHYCLYSYDLRLLLHIVGLQVLYNSTEYFKSYES